MLDLDIIKKTLMIGVGLAAVSKDKIETLAKTLAKKGNISEKEGKKLVDDMLKRAETAKNDLNEKVEEMVKNAVMKMDIATKEDLGSLKQQIKKLEKMLKEKES
ncbi:MAG: phasin family protein [Desulfobulbaceae bacterium]|nr:phasin family protein [Desulfobulbaceae bacterium]MCK5322601.1 phasin family protein [Desulfobulbaceae bacterium]MCK5436449.1 phasin family protein [Desulfobulbaceae bacterium]MCK5543986.1 phasin family protein [Desulfobulbaceae bacterium]